MIPICPPPPCQKEGKNDRVISDVTSSPGLQRKRAASHCVEFMVQCSDVTVRASVLRMRLLAAMAP